MASEIPRCQWETRIKDKFTVELFCILVLQKQFLKIRNVGIRIAFSGNEKRFSKVKWSILVLSVIKASVAKNVDSILNAISFVEKIMQSTYLYLEVLNIS